MKTIRDLCKEYGYSQTGLAKRFGIPLRTVQNWHGGQREPAPYVVPMMEEILQKEKAGGAERERGKWLTDRFGMDRNICSVCGATYEGDGGNFCRNCGAEMEEGKV